MGLTFRYSFDGIDWSALESLFKEAELGGRAGDKIRRAFENSQVVCFVLDGECLIGASRAITDWEYHAMIYDVVVHPDYQARGIGRKIMNALIERLPVWRILLVCDADRMDFYRKLGFEEIPIVMGHFDWGRLYD